MVLQGEQVTWDILFIAGMRRLWLSQAQRMTAVGGAGRRAGTDPGCGITKAGLSSAGDTVLATGSEGIYFLSQ